MRTKILYVILVLFAVGAIFFIINRSEPSRANSNNTGAEDQNGSSIIPNLPDINLPFSNSPQDVAWDLLQKYLEFNRQRDLEGVRSTVYKVAPVCNDPKLVLDCHARMGLAYNYGSQLKKQDFKNVWSDQKQIIISTDFRFEEDENNASRNRGIIFFIYDENNKLRLLSFSPFRGSIISKGAMNTEETKNLIERWTDDADQDGIEDYTEECLDQNTKDICVKTDPKSRDSDNDGLWDGTEFFMNKI